MAHADKAIVGCDAIAVNGALVNKIGTSQVATMAHEARVNFIVAAETYKLDFKTLTGELVDIEERDYTEIASKEWMRSQPEGKVQQPGLRRHPARVHRLLRHGEGDSPAGRGLLADEGAIPVHRRRSGKTEHPLIGARVK